MHIVLVAFEAAAFDARLIRGGVASLVWNLAREYAAAGHRVSVVTPAHGHGDLLRERWGAEEQPGADEHALPVVLDPAVWRGRPGELWLRLRTRTYLLRRDGVDLHFLADDLLDRLPDTIYPSNEMDGTDLVFLKPLVFQVDAIRAVRRLLGDRGGVVHAVEPYYHYLLPAVLGGAPGRTVISTVAVNPQINDKVYRPQVARLLDLLGGRADLDRPADPPLTDPLSVTMDAYLRPSHRTGPYGPDYVTYFSLVAAHTDVIDFVSDGQRQYYSTFRDSPYEHLFHRQTVSTVVRETAHKQFVGGCGLPDWWLDRDPAAVDRDAVLDGLGLDPARPTFYHAARYDPNHKGQWELLHAVDRVLRDDPGVNFVIRCATGARGVTGVGDAALDAIARRYPRNVRLDWRMVDEEMLYAHAACADFCVFPSKFELDGFLITLAEAMACGAVPIATAQETLSHFRHGRPVSDPGATGFAVPRSFRARDEGLVGDLTAAIRAAVRVHRDDRPTYDRLSRNARALARTFTWRRSAARRLERMRSGPPDRAELDRRAIANGWFDTLAPDAWIRHRGAIAESALRLADADAYRRAAPGEDAAGRLFDAAWRRADFARCAELAAGAGAERHARLANRCDISAGQVVYRHPHARRVDLVRAEDHGPDRGRGNRGTLPMTSGPTGFTATLPDRSPTHLVFLLTLRSGRTAWDVVPVPAAAVAPSAVGAGAQQR